jgi:hypothetical protein
MADQHAATSVVRTNTSPDITKEDLRARLSKNKLRHELLPVVGEVIVALGAGFLGPLLFPTWEPETAYAVVTGLAGVAMVFFNMARRRVRAERDELRERLINANAALEATNHALLAEVARLNKPILRGSLVGIVAGVSSHLDATGITLMLVVDNIWEVPTIVRGWRAEIDLPAGRTIPLELIHPPGTVTLETAGGGEIVYGKADTISEKTSVTVIQGGGSQSGYLLALAKDVPPGEASAKGTVFRVYFQDIQRTEYCASYTSDGNAIELSGWFGAPGF